MKPEPLTYAQLICNQAQLVELGQLNSQTAANRATALRQFLRTNHVQAEDVVGLEMRPHFLIALERLVTSLRAEGRSDRSISNTRSALTPWKLAVIADDTMRALEKSQLTPFVEVLRKSLAGQPVDRVSRQCGVPRAMLYGWLAGSMPRRSNAIYLRRIEAFFGLERESLVALAGITGSARALQRVGEAPLIEYRKKLGERSRSEYFLVPSIDSPLRQQWRALMQYKTSVVPALLRSSTGRWTFSSLVVVKERPANWFAFLDDVEVPTAKVAWSHTASFLGWMGLPTDQGGLGMAAENLQTLAWLAVPDYVEAYLEWLKKRCGGIRTRGTGGFLSLASNMVREKEGYLSQQPAFLKSLPEKFHSQDWRELCKRQSAYIAKLQNAFEPELVSNRDSFEPIRSIIELPQPLEAIADMVQRMRMDRPVGCITSEAIWARDIFMVKLFVSNPLRLRNMATLTWSKENIDSRKPTDRGSLYQRTDGSWWIFVPKHLLKNRRSKNIREYDSPVHQSVWGDLERYLLRHRKDLMRWPTDLVFLNRKRDPARAESVHKKAYKTAAPTGHTPFMEMSKRLYVLTKKHLWKSDGIGTHAFRHVVVTSILKADGGDIKTAALVLNDAEATVAKHYSGMRSGDGAARMGALLDKTLNRM